MTHTLHILDQEVVTFIEVELNMDQVHFIIENSIFNRQPLTN